MHKIKEKGNLGELKENRINILSMEQKFDNYRGFSILNFASKKQYLYDVEEKNYQPRILYLVKLSFKIERRIKNFMDKQKLRDSFPVYLFFKKCSKFFRQNKNDIGEKFPTL